MKNFKKSLLVVPALGVLMLAAAGSVGGTVAWFSSVNTFQTDISSFAVGRLSGDLQVTMGADRGTALSGNVISVETGAGQGDVKLTHGSFNHTVGFANYTTGVYVVSEETVTASATPAAEGGASAVSVAKATFLGKQNKPGTYTFTHNGSSWQLSGANVTLGDYGLAVTAGTPANGDQIAVTVAATYAADEDWKAFDGKRDTNNDGTPDSYWYYAVSWTMKFRYNWGSDTTKRNLYFNTNAEKSKITPTPAAASGLETFKGFRIAFVSATRTMIWAPEQATTAEINYVSSTSAITNTATANAAQLLYKGDSAVVADTASSAADTDGSVTNHNYLGKFVKVGDATYTDLDFKCVAWFDGTDINIQNAAVLHSVAAKLSFFAIDATA